MARLVEVVHRRDLYVSRSQPLLQEASISTYSKKSEISTLQGISRIKKTHSIENTHLILERVILVIICTHQPKPTTGLERYCETPSAGVPPGAGQGGTLK